MTVLPNRGSDPARRGEGERPASGPEEGERTGSALEGGFGRGPGRPGSDDDDDGARPPAAADPPAAAAASLPRPGDPMKSGAGAPTPACARARAGSSAAPSTSKLDAKLSAGRASRDLAALDLRSSGSRSHNASLHSHSSYSRGGRRVRRGDVVRPVQVDEGDEEEAGSTLRSPSGDASNAEEAGSIPRSVGGEAGPSEEDGGRGGRPEPEARDASKSEEEGSLSNAISNAISNSVDGEGASGGDPPEQQGAGASASDGSPSDGSPSSVLRLADDFRVQYDGRGVVSCGSYAVGSSHGGAGSHGKGGDDNDGEGGDGEGGGYDYSHALVLHSSAQVDDCATADAPSSRLRASASDSERRFVLPPVLTPPPPPTAPPSASEEPPERRFVLSPPPPPLDGAPLDGGEARAIRRRPSRQFRRGRDRGERGLDPSERVAVADRAVLRRGGPGDPPGERPGNLPVVCLDVVPYGGGSDGGSEGSGVTGRSSVRKVKWVDPKGLKSEGDVDRDVLRGYDDLASLSSSPGSSHRHRGVDPPPLFAAPSPSPTDLFRNPRTRIATVSSGYKKADFFVREDLDTRIYFHTLEDAVGYMARRGYRKMGGEEEGEWKALLGKAHGVVKKGNKKEKQRYRKGRLVMVLKKTVWDHGDPDDRKKSRRSSNRRKSKPQLLLLENGPSSSFSRRSSSSQTTDSRSASSRTTLESDRTSLGRSIRGGYRSYSEKFLAEQEEEKRRCLRAIVEGRPLPDARGGDDGGGRPLLLLADAPAERGGSAASRATGETSARGSALTDGTDRTGGDGEAFRKSVKSMRSNRKGVYGGGVHYFTPVPDDDDDGSEEETAEDDDFEEEETYEDEDEGGSYDEEVIEYDGSDMGSMFSVDDEVIDYNGNAGVESVDGSEGASRRGGADAKGRRGRGGRSRAPEMAPISDDSAYSADSY